MHRTMWEETEENVKNLSKYSSFESNRYNEYIIHILLRKTINIVQTLTSKQLFAHSTFAQSYIRKF